MKTILYPVVLCIALLCPAIYNSELFAQCGTAPTSGNTTLSSGIINTYYPGTGSPVSGASSIIIGARDTRGSSTVIAAGDLIFIVQIQGADINSSNSVSYGANGTSAPAAGYLNNANLVAGNYEYATVASVSGTTISLSYPLVNKYYTTAFTASAAIQTYQVIRVPRYYDLTINTGVNVTAPSWNGSTGGVIIIEAANAIALNGTVTVAASGFRGGGGKNLTGATTGNSSTNTGTTGLTNTDYRWNSPVTNTANLTGGAKGEGIAGMPAYLYTNSAINTTTGTVEGYINGSMGWGAPGNAGGGGTDGSPVGANSENQYNTGGGGGANGGAGGKGGNGWPGGAGTATTLYPTGGYGGAAFAQGTQQKIIMGGGGGAGTANNSSGLNEANSSGGQGGGIIIIRAYSYSGTGSVIADGGNAPGVTAIFSTPQTDAAGGGGAGGTIIIVTTQNSGTGMGSIKASAVGGIGGSVMTYYNHGPGGGGGGGFIYTDITLGSTAVTGGASGITYQTSAETTTYSYFSIAGNNGIVVTFSGASSFISTGTPCGVLPIILENFSAVLEGTSFVDINWKIQNESNFNYFEIERSTDGINFYNIGDEGYANAKTDYQFIDQSPQAGNNFYRLKLVDADGKFVYSNILLVKINSTNNSNGLLIYPNPALSFATLQYNADMNQQISVELFDNNGKKLINKNFMAEKGQNYFSIPDIKYLPKSIYFIKVNNGSKIFTQKLLLNK